MRIQLRGSANQGHQPPQIRRNLVGPGQQRSPHDDGGVSLPARTGFNRAAINAWNQHGVPSGARLRNRRVGGGGRGRADNQQSVRTAADSPGRSVASRKTPASASSSLAGISSSTWLLQE